MKPGISRLCALAQIVLAPWVAAVPVGSESAPGPDAPPVLGLDHIPLAVADLEGATQRYRRLGFALKPGRPHENGIRNQHVKFPDGTEIELISAPAARDSLTAAYRRHLAAGDGPAFVAFYAPAIDPLARRLDAAGKPYHRDGGHLTFPQPDELRYIFFGPRNHSPTDRPEHFRHQNGAEALIGVWLAGDDLASERELLRISGATFAEQEVCVPRCSQATVARLPQAEVVFLPRSRQLVPGRRIVGATLRTRDLDAVRRVLAASSWSTPPVVEGTNGRSLFLPPSLTQGIWLEFRQQD